MSGTTDKEAPDAAHEFINNLGDNEKSAMEAARKFVDAGNRVALNIVDLTESALEKAEERAEEKGSAGAG
jgi:hypothetical protein